MTRRRVVQTERMEPHGPGTLVLDVLPRLAVRYDDAARMIGISENMLRELVDQGKVHAPVALSKKVVLFDVATLTHDWQSIRFELMGGHQKPAKPSSALDDLLG